MKHNRLTFIEDIGMNKHRNRIWRCLCDCGNEAVGLASEIRSGHKKSCGCLVKDTSRELIKRARTFTKHEVHGHATGGTSYTYQSWRSMMQRCYDPSIKGYKYWGG